MKNLVTLALVALAIAGCAGRAKGPSALTDKLDVEVAINTSTSSSDLINKSLVASVHLGREAPQGSRITWYRMFADTKEVRTFIAPFSAAATLTQIQGEFPPNQDFGTRLDVFLGRTLVTHRRAGSFYLIVVYGDGFAETTDPRVLQTLAGNLAKQSSFLGIVFVGARTGSREFLRANLAPLAVRLQFIALGEPIPFAELSRGGGK